MIALYKPNTSVFHERVHKIHQKLYYFKYILGTIKDLI